MRGFHASDPARIASYLAGYFDPDERLGDKEASIGSRRAGPPPVGRWWSVRGVTRVRVEVRVTRR